MRIKLKHLPIIILSAYVFTTFLCSNSSAQNVDSAPDTIITKKKFSILGSDKDKILLSISTGTTTSQPVVSSDGVVKSTTSALSPREAHGQPAAAVNSPQPVQISSGTAETPQGYLPPVVLLPPSAAGKAGENFINYLNQKKIAVYSREKWETMKKNLESERRAKEEPHVYVSTAPRTSAPLPPGLSVELPYESQLSISGRKAIGVTLKTTIYEKEEPQKRQSTTSFDMTQELQVRIKGQVGRKINVNVDFDDTNADKRDISVVYKGDPDEVVQDAAFGDISVSLPSSEFVGYSKQLFGINLHTKYKGLESWGFFSRTKGTSEMKKFTGSTKTNRVVVKDTDFIPMKYYEARFGAEYIKSGSMRVYLDDRNINNNNITTSSNVVVGVEPDSFTSSAYYGYTYKGDFDLLVAGQDYTVDYDRGIIAFRRQLTANYVVAIDYIRSGETAYRGWKLIKDEANTIGITRELKTFYSLGHLQIVRDNGKGNFILKIQDPNKNDEVPDAIIGKASEPNKPTPKYSYNINESNIVVDFESGIFYFEPPEGTPFHNSLYTAEKEHKYNIFTEYSYLEKDTLQLGRFDIVPESERVVMNGVQLVKDKDYFIDYDVGMITFFNKDKINENTVIEVTYDYAPFGTAGGSTLVGTRSQLSLTKDIFVGGSFIYDFAAKTTALPDIKTTPTSLMVWEVDSKLNNIQVPFTPLSISLSGEYAESLQNPNISDKAMIESMEGVKQEDSASTFRESWQPSANPNGESYFISYVNNKAVRYDKGGTGDIGWDNEDVSLKDINPSVGDDNQDKRQVLTVDYDFHRSNQLSIVQPLSKVGNDYSKKIYLETWIYGDGNNETLSIAYGAFNEDADGKANGTLKTEDINNTGTLVTGADVGWNYIQPDGTVSAINIKSKLDTEDLNGDGILNTVDDISPPSPYTVFKDTADVSYSAVTWTGWKLLRVPLNITTANQEQWKAVKQVRLTLTKNSLSSNGPKTIKIANLSLINNKWEDVTASVTGSSLTISAVNNQDDPEYFPLFNEQSYKDLYEMTSTELKNAKEQSLSLKYENFTATSTVQLTARLRFVKDTGGRSYDFSNYARFGFYIYGVNTAPGDVFFIQVGNDNNYFEYHTVGSINNGIWQYITINQLDMNDDNKSETWSVALGSVTKVGSPTLDNISQIRVGVKAQPGSSILERKIYVDEIHVLQARQRKGSAWRLNADLSWPGWMTAGGKRKEVNRNFQTFSAGVYNRDTLEDSGYLNLSAISFLPINTTLSKTRNVTPGVVQNQGDIVSVLEEGRVVSYSGTVSVAPDLKRMLSPLTYVAPPVRYLLPGISGSYSRNITDTHDIQRLEDRETLSGSANYAFPFQLDTISPFNTGVNIFPLNLSANYSVTNTLFKVYPSTAIVDRDDFLDIPTLKQYLDVKEYSTWEINETYGGNAPFQFWRGFNFTPTYSLSRVKERKTIFDAAHREYQKSAAQNISASSDLTITSWLSPKFNYSLSINENYDLSYNTNTVVIQYPSRFKQIERRSNGDVSWSFNVKDLVKFKFTESLGFTASYSRFDNDIYENVESSFPVINVFDNNTLWIRNNPLKPLTDNTTAYYRVKTIIERDENRFSGRYNPFEAFKFQGRLAPISTLTTNITYTNSNEFNYQTGTKKQVISQLWPDLTIGLGKWEKFFWLERWFDNTTFNLRHQKKSSITKDVSESFTWTYGSDLRFTLKKKLDISIGGSYTLGEDLDTVTGVSKLTKKSDSETIYTQTGFDLKKWRLSVRYDYSKNWQEDGMGKATADNNTHSATVQATSDMSFPRGMPLPFTKKTLPLTNRLIVNSALKYAYKMSSLNVSTENRNDYNLTASADYEVSANFRAALSTGYSYVQNRANPEENYHSIEATARVTIQF